MGGLSLDLSLSLTSDSGRAPPIDPLTLSPTVWYDPSDLSTLWQDTAGTVAVTTDGQAVARINDKSGNAYHLTHGTAANRPLYKTSGGLHWLDFDGVDDFLSIAAGPTIAQPDTMVAAILFENAAGSIATIWDSSGADQLMGSMSSNNYRIFAGTASVSGGTRNAAAHVMYGFANGASSTLKIDNIQVASGDPGTANFNTALYLGCYGGASQFVDGRFYGGGIIPRALTTAEEAGLFSHLAIKAGI